MTREPLRSRLRAYFPGRGGLFYHLYPLPDSNALYVKNPKAGCSSVLLWLDRGYTGEHDFDPGNVHTENRLPRPQDLGWPVVRRMLTDDDTYRFTFVREPLRRLESSYWDKVARPGQWKDAVQTTLLGAPDADHDVSFEMFVSAIEQQDPKQEMDPHWRPQHVNLLHPEIAYTRIGHLESFDDDLATIAEEAGLPPAPQQHRNASKRTGTDSVYDGRPDLVRRVQTIYALDYELYGY